MRKLHLAIIRSHLCSTHHTLAPCLLLLHKLDIASTDGPSTEIQQQRANGQLRAGNHHVDAKLCFEDLLLVGLHVKADFVTCVQVDIALNIINGVGKIEHFLWTVTPAPDFNCSS